MNMKILQLLDLLLSNHGSVSFDRVCAELGFTRRMLFYYQKKLNEHLRELELPLSALTDGMLKIDCRSRHQFQILFQMGTNTDYVMEPKERQDFILLKIGLSAESVTLESLQEMLDISRSTTLTDINEVKNTLGQHDISLQSRHRGGYYLEGDELNIRYVLMSSGYNMKGPVVSDLKMEMLLEEVARRSGKHLNKDIILSIRDIIRSSEKELDKQFNYFSINDTAESLLLVYLRSFHAHTRIRDDAPGQDLNQTPVRLMIEQMNDLGLVMSKEEANYIQVLLMGARTCVPGSQSADPQVEAFTRALLASFEQLSQIRLSRDTVLFQMFLLHIQPMFYRAKYRIKLSNVMDSAVQKVSGSFYYITRLTVDSCCKTYDLYMDDDEIHYLSIYFSCIGDSSSLTDNLQKLHILIVCGSGLGSSIYVKNQLERILGGDYRYDITDVRNIKTSITDRTVLVVSTVELPELYSGHAIPVLKVSTVISREQKAELIQWMLEYNFSAGDARMLSEVVEIVSKSAAITDHETLICDLRHYFNKETQPELAARLEQICFPEYLSVCEDPIDWKEAIYFAGMPLIEHNCIDPGYLEDIIDGIEEHGPYAECRQGMLLAHARPSVNVRRLSLSAALFKEPVHFEQWNKTMDIVFILAVTDHKSHATVLVELIDNLSELNSREELTDCRTIKAFYSRLLHTQDP